MKDAEYMKANNLTKIALVTVNSSFGESGRVEFEKAAAAIGISIVAEEKFGADDKDMTAQLTRIKAKQPQAVLVWATPPSASIITKNFRQLGFEIPLLHSHGIANQTFINLAGTDANGVIFPAGRLLVAEKLPDTDPQKQIVTEFATLYEGKYQQPRSAFGGHAYDGLNLVVQAIAKVGPDRTKLRDELEKTQNFIGVTGIFNMSPTDHAGLTKDSMVMIKIVDGQWQLLETNNQ
jgi:branched-chain amino acid transport system substrate-binding protein